MRYGELFDESDLARRIAYARRRRRHPGADRQGGAQGAAARTSWSGCSSPSGMRPTRSRTSCAGSRANWTDLVDDELLAPAHPDPRRARRRKQGRRERAWERSRRRRRRASRGGRCSGSGAPRRSPSRSAPTATGCPTWCSWPRAPTSGSTSCRAPTAGPSGPSTASPTRSSTRLRDSGLHRPVAHRTVGAQPRQSQRIKQLRGNPEAVASAYSLDGLPHRRRPGRRGRRGTTCATGRGRAASGSPRTWCPTTWASTPAG